MRVCVAALPCRQELENRNAAVTRDVLGRELLDSGAKGLPKLGATGETHDWSVARAVVERSRLPVILAGGLSADNVAQAIAAVRPWGVDSFTHTDVPGNRGKKDPARVRAFIAAALRGFADVIAS